MSKIELNDTGQDVLFKMSEGNPGALTACIDVMRKGSDIDPDNFMGGIGALFNLDSFGIYGPSIYVLWNDKCGRNTSKFILLIRACQLGIISRQKLSDLSNDQVGKINIDQSEWDRIKTGVLEVCKDFNIS